MRELMPCNTGPTEHGAELQSVWADGQGLWLSREFQRIALTAEMLGVSKGLYQDDEEIFH